MRVQREVDIGLIAVPMINLGCWCGCFVSDTLHLLYLRGRTTLPTAEETGWVQGSFWNGTEKKPLLMQVEVSWKIYNCDLLWTPHGMFPMQWSTPTWVFLQFKTSSMIEVTSTEPNYSLIPTHSYNPYQQLITSHGDRKEDGQLTCNQE